ncbi:MAG: hypothetical protein HY398_00820 [Candidatus Doudnabacteria bacterium]|nr:hypothetical protein [Candidatus Doudnabacteria bacterium]
MSNLLMRRRKKAMKPLARVASAIVRDLEPYSIFQSFMNELRRETGHKGFPRVRNGMLLFNTPAASGGATMHTYNPSDDVEDIVPSQNDLFMIAMQAGNVPGAMHIGGGSCQGEHYWMLPPRTPFFPRVQERVNADPELNRVWGEVAQFGGTKAEKFTGSSEWLKATQEIKDDVIKEVVPELIGQRVLGFHVDMNRRTQNRVAAPCRRRLALPEVSRRGRTEWPRGHSSAICGTSGRKR